MQGNSFSCQDGLDNGCEEQVGPAARTEWRWHHEPSQHRWQGTEMNGRGAGRNVFAQSLASFFRQSLPDEEGRASETCLEYSGLRLAVLKLRPPFNEYRLDLIWSIVPLSAIIGKQEAWGDCKKCPFYCNGPNCLVSGWFSYLAWREITTVTNTWGITYTFTSASELYAPHHVWDFTQFINFSS